MNSSPDPEQFSVRRADWVKDRDALRSVRTLVFIEEQAVPKDLEWDDEDAVAEHLLAVEATGRPIGTARLLPSAQIGRMAVLPQWRNRGVGSALLREILKMALSPNRPAPFLNAQISSAAFYLKMGFEPVGEQFDEAGIPHQRMRLSAGSDAKSTMTMNLREHVLGETAGPVRLESPGEMRSTSALMAGQAIRELRIFSRDLDAALYDQYEFLESVRRLALANPRAPVHILVVDAAPAVRRGHRLLELARQLSSRIAIRRIPAEFHHHTEAYLLADDQGYVLRSHADLTEGSADFAAPSRVRRLLEQFEHIWDRSAEPPELRTFARGL